MVVFKINDSVPSARYSSICNVLIESTDSMIYLYLFLYILYELFYWTVFSREFNNYVGNCIFLIK